MEMKNQPKIYQPTLEQLAWRCSVVPDPPDRRDWIVEVAHPSVPSTSEPLRTKVDYSAQTPAVEDQGDYGSCVGWATVRGLREWMYRKTTGKDVRLSVRFVWMAAKESDHFEINSFVANAGTSLKTAFKVLQKYGVPEDRYYPYDKDLVSFTSLSQRREFFFNATKYRIFNYYMLSTNDARRVHLANVGPFVATVPIDQNWMRIGADGMVPDKSDGAILGGHALFIVGYNDQTEMFKFKNSWGSAWGQKGFGYFSYKYAEKNMWTAIGTDLVPEIKD